MAYPRAILTAAMSEENTELLKRAVDAYNRRDLEALLSELDPDVEWRPALPGLLGAEAPTYRGHEGIAEMLRDLYEVLDLIHFDYTEVRDLGDRVIAIGHIRTRGKASGVETEAPYANVADVENGKGIRIQGYLDVDEALEAARSRQARTKPVLTPYGSIRPKRRQVRPFARRRR
jgi:ketosteroid isomerase-like protein